MLTYFANEVRENAFRSLSFRLKSFRTNPQLGLSLSLSLYLQRLPLTNLFKLVRLILRNISLHRQLVPFMPSRLIWLTVRNFIPIGRRWYHA